MADRTMTFPAEEVQHLADLLCDMHPHLSGDEAEEMARDIVIDVTLAVDRLRALEAKNA